jgi:hypothetical protein
MLVDDGDWESNPEMQKLLASIQQQEQKEESGGRGSSSNSSSSKSSRSRSSGNSSGPGLGDRVGSGGSGSRSAPAITRLQMDDLDDIDAEEFANRVLGQLGHSRQRRGVGATAAALQQGRSSRVPVAAVVALPGERGRSATTTNSGTGTSSSTSSTSKRTSSSVDQRQRELAEEVGFGAEHENDPNLQVCKGG